MWKGEVTWHVFLVMWTNSVIGFVMSFQPLLQKIIVCLAQSWKLLSVRWKHWGVKVLRIIMKNFIVSFLTLLTILCLYIITYVGLGYGWAIGCSDNWQRINAVALNLSYSYIAGLIFYLFTSTLPYYFRKTKVAKIIKEKKGWYTDDCSHVQNVYIL